MRVTVNAAKGTATILSQIKTNKKLKLKVSCGNNNIFHTITDSIVVPLTFGSGTYSFTLYQQLNGNKYAQKTVYRTKISLDAKAYTLSANSYVNYNENSSFYILAQQLGNLDNIFEYLQTHFYYDFIEALTTASNAFTTPDLEKCFKNKKGVCYNISALFTAMLRICGISAKLVVGYADGSAHSWVEVNNIRYDITQKLIHTNIKNYKSERYY